MAKVTLALPGHGEELSLAPLCVRCGNPDVEYVRRRFTWTPPMVCLSLPGGIAGMTCLSGGGAQAVLGGLVLSLVVFVILVAGLSRTCVLHVPVCPVHRHHWRTWRLLLYAVPAFLLLVVLVDQFLVEEHTGLRALVQDLRWPIVLMLLVIAVGAPVAFYSTMVRAEAITERSMTLRGTCPDFAQACMTGKAWPGPLDEAAAQHWQSPGKPVACQDDRIRTPDDRLHQAGQPGDQP